MNQDFTYVNPTKIYFGKDSFNNLEEELKKYGKNILLVYGKGSIKKIGLYDKVIEVLKKLDKNVYECSGVMPNPTWDKVIEGAKLVRDHKIDFILAMGGGSVIDCSKAISASAYCVEKDLYDYIYVKKLPIKNDVVPLGSILTMVGTGSEMNPTSVITNNELKLKKGRTYDERLFPKFSILNPEYTYSLPIYQMKSGIFDIFSHLMEQYFSGHDDNVSDYLIEGLMRCLIRNSKVAFDNPLDYEARSNIMWTATCALNKFVGLSKDQDWEVHSIEHQLGAYTDCAHGMGLAAISIPYYKHIYKDAVDKFYKFAVNVWNVNPLNKSEEEVALEGLKCLENYIKESGMVTSIEELGATKEMLHDIAFSSDEGGGYRCMKHEEILEVLKECY